MSGARMASTVALLAGLAVGVPAGGDDVESAANATVITSDRLTYDAPKQYALFEKNVVVTDPQLQLLSDKLTLYFDKDGAAKTILAEGHVRITQGDKKSNSEKATYDVASGEIVLEGQPRVTRGQDVLEGETITFWRNQNRMVCYPRARLVIFPSEDGSHSKLIGE
jgi:lipopolysaccharide export system protein LptA